MVTFAEVSEDPCPVFCGPESTPYFHTSLAGCCTNSEPAFQTADLSLCVLLLQLCPLLTQCMRYNDSYSEPIASLDMFKI